MMRKRIIHSDQQQIITADKEWLDIEQIAVVEVSSEKDAFPIESALLRDNGSEWHASDPGKQIIRLIFDKPQKLQWIKLHFEELTIERTQEYVLHWSPDNGKSYQEIIRQQWNFSPAGATSEIEDFQVALPAVTILELIITPDINKQDAFASLKKMWLA